jgi:hypothetical protein
LPHLLTPLVKLQLLLQLPPLQRVLLLLPVLQPEPLVVLVVDLPVVLEAVLLVDQPEVQVAVDAATPVRSPQSTLSTRITRTVVVAEEIAGKSGRRSGLTL